MSHKVMSHDDYFFCFHFFFFFLLMIGKYFWSITTTTFFIYYADAELSDAVNFPKTAIEKYGKCCQKPPKRQTFADLFRWCSLNMKDSSFDSTVLSHLQSHFSWEFWSNLKFYFGGSTVIIKNTAIMLSYDTAYKKPSSIIRPLTTKKYIYILPNFQVKEKKP